MTSSYNLSRRKDLYSPKNIEAFGKQFGVCPPSYISVPVSPGGNCSDWKICVPIPNEEGNNPKVPIMKDILARQNEQPFRKRRTYNFYDKISANKIEIDHYEEKFGVKSHPPPVQYQSPTNFFPIKSREMDRRALDKFDYYQLPLRFDGTGYNKIKPWEYNESAMGHVQMRPEWNPFELIQRNEVQKKFYA